MLSPLTFDVEGSFDIRRFGEVEEFVGFAMSGPFVKLGCEFSLVNLEFVPKSAAGGSLFCGAVLCRNSPGLFVVGPNCLKGSLLTFFGLVGDGRAGTSSSSSASDSTGELEAADVKIFRLRGTGWCSSLRGDKFKEWIGAGEGSTMFTSAGEPSNIVCARAKGARPLRLPCLDLFRAGDSNDSSLKSVDDGTSSV